MPDASSSFTYPACVMSEPRQTSTSLPEPGHVLFHCRAFAPALLFSWNPLPLPSCPLYLAFSLTSFMAPNSPLLQEAFLTPTLRFPLPFHSLSTVTGTCTIMFTKSRSQDHRPGSPQPNSESWYHLHTLM